MSNEQDIEWHPIANFDFATEHKYPMTRCVYVMDDNFNRAVARFSESTRVIPLYSHFSLDQEFNKDRVTHYAELIKPKKPEKQVKCNTCDQVKPESQMHICKGCDEWRCNKDCKHFDHWCYGCGVRGEQMEAGGGPW